MIRKIALGFGALLLIYLGYLSWRIWDERQDVSAKVDRIIGRAHPDELRLPPHRVSMLLRVEDPTFWTNKGIDLSTPGAGLTTLSQGLGKQIFFEGFEPGLAKLELMALTRFALYPEVDKPRTLNAIVANAYFGTKNGRPIVGFADAAQVWFDKPLSTLTDSEFLSLQAMLVAPDRLKPGSGDRERNERVARIERLLARRCQPSGLRDVMLEGCA